MTELRIINVILWSGVLLYMLPAAWNAAFGKQVRRGDPMRLGVFATSFVMISFFARWLIAPESILTWQALHVLAAAVAIYIGFLARSYGRGDHV